MKQLSHCPHTTLLSILSTPLFSAFSHLLPFQTFSFTHFFFLFFLLLFFSLYFFLFDILIYCFYYFARRLFFVLSVASDLIRKTLHNSDKSIKDTIIHRHLI